MPKRVSMDGDGVQPSCDEQERSGPLDDGTLVARELAIEGIVELLSGLQRTRHLSRAAREQGAGEPPLGRSVPRFTLEVGDRGLDLTYDLARLQLDIVRRVLTFQREHASVLFDPLRHARRERDALVSVAWQLDPQGRLATHAEPVCITLENRSGARVRGAVQLSELRAGAPSIAAPRALQAHFSPREFELPPHGELTLVLQLQDESRELVPSSRYEASVEVELTGRTRRLLPLSLVTPALATTSLADV